MKYAVAVDSQGKTWAAWGNRYWPSIYLIDKKGVVRHKNMAFKPGAKEDYDALRAALMKLQSSPAQ